MPSVQKFFRRLIPWRPIEAQPDDLTGPIRGQVMGVDRLAQRARAAAKLHKVAVPDRREQRAKRGPGPLLRRLDETRRILAHVQRRLSDASTRGVDVSSPGEWLLDNYYIVQEHMRDIRTSLPDQYYQELPKLASGDLAGYPRVYALAIELISHTEGRLDLENIALFTREYQRVSPLRLGELWAIPTMLRLGLVENIRRMALRTDARLREVEDADTWALRLREASASQNDAVWKNAMSLFMDSHPPLTPTFVARFLTQVRSYQAPFTPLLWLEQWIAEDGPSAEEAVTRSNRRVAITQVTVTNSITSLRTIARLDWNEFVETQSATEQILRGDPAGVYAQMSFATRDRYRHVVEQIAKRCQVPEEEVAQAALRFAQSAQQSAELHTSSHVADNAVDLRNVHIGYWLIDEGLPALHAQFSYQLTIGERIYRYTRQKPSRVYFGAIFLVWLIVMAAVISLLGITSALMGLGVVLLLAVPASEVAVAIVNQIVTMLVPPRVLPKLEFSEDGVPAVFKTVVVVPTLFGTVSAVREALEHLEIQYLANRDPNIRFAVLSDFTDANTEVRADDEQILDVARRSIQALNDRYRSADHPHDPFLLFHRPRKWNETQGVWMGWERKRGKLAQFNRFVLTGDRTPFSVVIGNADEVIGARYVITLDSDTVLPRDAAHLLIGAMAHPLNQGYYNPELKRVTRGYGIMQPRVGVALTSAYRSKFAAVHSGHPGVDPYTTAVSDVYQDLYGEGSFTGKGIYDVRLFEQATYGRFPEDTLLSHDLIEGTYARAALVTDVEVYDDYPTRYLAYTRRRHRWIRGDWQIVRWLRSRVPGPEGMELNRLSAISRWKILDNLRRSVIEVTQLLLLLAGWFVFPGSALLWTGIVLVLMAMPWLFSTAVALLQPPADQSWRAYYAAVRSDVWTSAQQLFLAVTFLPHQAVVAADAIVRTLVRMTITHRNLLEWQTASQVERAMRTRAEREVYRRMWPAVAIGAMAGVGAVLHLLWHPAPGMAWQITFLAAILPLALLWIISPTIVSALSAPAIPGEIKLSESEQAAALRYAALHWKYFETFVTEDTHWLAPDNFQEDPAPVVAMRTSPTNIGLQLLSIVSAADLGIISLNEMIDKLERVFRTLERLPRHRGHFYNWYDLATLQPLEPKYISTVDSGNLAGHLVALKQACIQLIHEMQPRTGEFLAPGKAMTTTGVFAAAPGDQMKGTIGVEEEITADRARLQAIADRAFRYASEMDFSFLFDEQRKLFSIGFQMSSNTFDNSYYDLLASEARLASFMAVANGDVPVEHWFRLGRSLTTVGKSRVLLSWSGSMFEYLMPVLVMQAYPSTLLEQSYRASVRRQIAYGSERMVPWGVSESAYNVRDRNYTYQYRGFGVPDLALKRGLSQDLVIAPYATVLAMLVEPRQALRNLTVLEGEGALGPYGFRDAIDYTRPATDARKAVVGAYMAHHIGMSLVAFTNALNRQVWQRRFHADPLVRSNELVLHERVPRRLLLQESSHDDSVPRVTSELTRPAVREMNTPHTSQPRIVILGNVPYTTVITNAGGGYSRYNDIVVTRWRRDTTRDNQGEWIYLKDLSNGRVWSASHQPVGVDADVYHVQFAADRATFKRTDGEIDTTMEVVVSTDDAAEVRRVMITNRSTTERDIELTSYAEIVLQPLDADRQHPAFGNLFVQTEWIPTSSAILATRRPRGSSDKVYWAGHVVSTIADRVGPVTYETDRATFIGRGKSVRHPEVLEGDTALLNFVGAPLDPIFALRVRVRVPAGKSVFVNFTTFVSESRDRALELADLYANPFSARRAIDLCWAQTQAELRDLNISPADAAVYQQLAGYLMYPHPRLTPTSEEVHGSQRGQQSLWPMGISGDLPILLATINSRDGIPSIRQLLQAHQYWRIKGLKSDLIILNEHGPSYLQELSEMLTSAVLASGESAILDQPGGVFIRRSDLLSAEQVALLRSMARVHVECDGLGLGNLLDFPDERESYSGKPESAVPARFTPRVAGHTLAMPPHDERPANGYGFFNDANEYEIRLYGAMLPPAPWSNVIANSQGGFLITEAGSGFVWAGNSFFYRLTPWHNDPVRDPCSDCIYLRDNETGDVWTSTPAPIRELSEYIVKHGIGYSIFEHVHGDIHTSLHVSVAEHDAVKISTLRITNTGSSTKHLTVTSYVEWVLGVSRDLTQQYVRTSYDEVTESLVGRNYFDEDYSHRVAFLTMSEPVESYTGDRREFIGRNGTPARPAGVAKTVLSDTVGQMVDPCGALQCSIVIEPGATHEIVVLLGAHDSLEQMRELVGRYKSVPQASVEREHAVTVWRDRVETIQVRTPEPTFDRLLNGWLLYQTLSCRVWGRSALYQSSGAYGYRDQLQDAMGLLYTEPGIAREQIIRAASRQFVEGDVQHWWHPRTGRGVRTRFSDDLAWLPFVVEQYIAVTNDTGVLDEEVSYITMRTLEPHEHEIYDLPQVSDERGSVYDHCVRALRKACTFGVHDLPLIGSGDWNDGMSRVGVEGKGESVWLAWFLIDILKRFAPRAAARGDMALHDTLLAWAERYRAGIEAHAWDGEWYIRAFFDDGAPLGSHTSDEAKIDAIAQSWSVISGAGDAERSAKAMQSLEQHLVVEDARLIRLLAPSFDQTAHDPGYIKGYLPGVRENGGQYTHAALWAVMAVALQERGTRAFELFQMINPITHSLDKASADRYHVEPYVVAADVYTAEGHVGRGGWTWYTGSASWMYRVGLEVLLGFAKRGNALTFAPRIPAAWDGYQVVYRFGTSTYTIAVENPDHVEHGVAQVLVDGNVVQDNVVLLSDDGAQRAVRIIMGHAG